ncbi:MAG: hypothetical protein U0670_12640 [Anaerolineae bacterium]
MPIVVYWDDESQTIVHVEIAGKWEWTELFGSIEQLVPPAKSAGKPHIDFIMHFVTTPQLPRDILSQLRNINSRFTDRLRTIAVIGANPIFKTIDAIVRQLFPHQQQVALFVADVEQARRVIHERRQDTKTE